MTSFRLTLLSSRQSETIDGVVSFTGRSKTGSFGILANAERRMTALSFGLARFRTEAGATEYLALPGGILYFVENDLSIVTISYLRSTDYTKIRDLLDETIRIDEERIREIRVSLHRLDQEIIQKMTKLGERPIQ